LDRKITMKLNVIKICILNVLIVNFFIIHLTWGQVDKAYQHLYNVMDKYHQSFDVFTDQDAGGNNFHPTLFGECNKLEMTSGCLNDSLPGWSCIKIKYSASEPSNYGWAGIYWLYPDKNWGDYPGNYIFGADSLIFWAKGESGSEQVEFKIGGVNHFPGYDQTKPFHDSCELLSTGFITLSQNWKRYAIDLMSPDSFAIYIDSNSGSNNHYVPAQWYNGSLNMEFDEEWQNNPHSGISCIRVHWNGLLGDDFGFWNGIMWQAIEGDYLNGYDLTGTTNLTFWARTDNSGLKVEFKVGYSSDTCGEIIYNGTLSNEWQMHTINLQGKDLSNIAGGFSFVFDYFENLQYPDSFTFYLDDIKYDKELKKDLSNIIGGFCCAVEKERNQQGCTFYLDNIYYNLIPAGIDSMKMRPHLLVSYEATESPIDTFLRNPAYIYDNALAMIAFMNRGTDEDWQRAGILANTFLECQKREPGFADNRLRNGYQSGLVIDRLSKRAVLPGVWKEKQGKRIWDQFSANTNTGNIAWVIIALLKYYEVKGGEQYLNCAEVLAEWIDDYTFDLRGAGGFTGGYEEFGRDKVLWKSTEHNLDVYVAFTKLDSFSSETKWDSLAQHAKRFVEAMWNENDKYFWTGTDQDGITINKKDSVEDVQSWAKLVFNLNKRYRSAVEWARENCYKECDGFKGFDFNTDKDGIWFEGTAHICLAFQNSGKLDSSDFYLNQLRDAQVTANHNNKLGIVAACHDSVTTGFDWFYHNRLHVGATAWYIFAEQQFNPYWQCSSLTKVKLNDIKFFPESYVLYQNYPNPFNHETVIKYELSKDTKVSLKIYNVMGQEIKNLLDDKQNRGKYIVKWNGKDENEVEMASGVYIYRLFTEEHQKSIKLILLR